MNDKKEKLFSTCESGDKSVLLQLIKSEGVNPSAYDIVNNEGKTALHIACRYGHIDIVRRLVEIYGCSLNSVDNTGSVPFHDACFYDQVEIVDYLIHFVKDPSTLLLAADIRGNTAFHKANQSGSSQVVKYILYIAFTGMTPCKLYFDDFFLVPVNNFFSGLTMTFHLQEKSSHSYFHVKNKIGDTAIAVACRHGHLSIISMYIRIHVHCHTHFFYNMFDFRHLIDVASQCGQFEVAYYLQSVSINNPQSESNLAAYYHERDQYDILQNNRGRWCLMNITSNQHAISKRPFCMAVLQGDVQYARKFLEQQRNCCYSSIEFDSGHAACISDDIRMLQLGFLFTDRESEFGNTPLHTACEWGSVNTVKYLITEKKCDVNTCNDFGETPLHLACRHKRTEIVKLLLESSNCISINKVNNSKESPLHLACLLEDSSIANLILTDRQFDHSDIDIPDVYGDTPLMNACRKGNVFIVKSLIDKGSNPAYANEYSMETPIHVVCRMQRLDILQVLVKNIASDSKFDHRNKFGETPLCVALDNYYTAAVDLLVSKKLCNTSLSLRSSEYFHPRSQLTGDTALHLACERDNIELVQLLVDHSPVDVVNSFGNTPFHVAALNRTTTVMECLIKKYSGPDSIGEFVNFNGDSVLHLACKKGSFLIVNLLLDHYCNVTLKDKSGNTPIHIACYMKKPNIVACLLKKCSGNLDCHRNNDDNTILHEATLSGDLQVVKLLLIHCSATCQNSSGDTPIHIACSMNQHSVVEYLLDSSKSTDPIVNKKGQTYLHAACNKHGKLEVVKLFFEKGYTILGNYPDNDGNTPLHYACLFCKEEIVKYLLTNERCDPYYKNNDDFSPLYNIVKSKRFELLKKLLNEKLFDPNQSFKKKSTLLHCLFEHDGYRNLPLSGFGVLINYLGTILSMVEFLVNQYKASIDFNATNNDGNTVLHLACKLEDYDIVHLLLSMESDVVCQLISCRNHDNKTPIQLTSDYRIISILISYGANPEDVYERFAAVLKKSKEEQPLEPTVKIIVLGNSTAGKTTLVEALKSSKSGMINVHGSTAGIETCEHNSDDFGRVTFHDFAGQPEYDSSHSAFLERCSSSLQPPIFLLVVDASQYQYVEKQVHNWLSFVQNHCSCTTETPPHVIVIGSHVDKVESILIPQLNEVFVKAIDHFKSSLFKCFQPVFLDCRKVGTEEMKKLCSRLKDSCASLKIYVELDCRCHILFANLAKWFPTDPVVKVKDLQQHIRQRKSIPSKYQAKRDTAIVGILDYGLDEDSNDSSENDLEDLLPISTDPLLGLLKSLHTGGHILLLEGEEDSWIVMNQDALFKTVNGILFAPKGFEQHFELDNNTGVVPLLKLLNTLFPDLDFNMVKQFLVHYEFCHQIEDNETLELIHGSDKLLNKKSVYYFFPGFVMSEKPSMLWDLPKDSESPYSFSNGWILQCQSKQFFDTRFLHVLLLRLTFTFVALSSEASVLKKQCDIWKNGIHWGTRNGVEIMVELIEEKTVVLMLVRCFKGQELEAVKLRTAVLRKIWKAKQEFCPMVEANEYLIHPSELRQISFQTMMSHTISISEIARTIIEGSPFVICPFNNKPLPLDTLLYYEPYSRMGKDHIEMLFSNKNINVSIPPESLLSLSNFLHPVYQHLVTVLQIPLAELGYHKEKWHDHPVQLLHHLFESWTSRREQPTFGTLRSEFDQYSIFFGRDPLVSVRISLCIIDNDM
jgi:ankyrin repeat protein